MNYHLFKKIYFIVSAIYLLGLSLHGFAQTDSSQSPEQLKVLADKSNTEALILIKNGTILLEEYFERGHPDSLIETMSCTKSIAVLAVMHLIQDGLIDSLETPIYHFFPEWNQGQKKQITIWHLVSMTSGIQNVPNATVEIYPSPNFVQLALAAELSNTPGEKFSYNNKALNLISGLIERISGLKLDEYIANFIFQPLDIQNFNWTYDKSGNPHVMSGCQLRPIDFAKIGQLILNHGEYNGKQIIDAQLIKRIVTPIPQNPEYGLLWWIHYTDKIYVVDEQIVASLRANEVDSTFIIKYEKLVGKYPSRMHFMQSVQKEFGTDFMNILRAAVPPSIKPFRTEHSGKISAYSANGYLGNYLVVVPEKQMVAVRMISYNHFDQNKGMKDSFQSFTSIISDLKTPLD